MQKITPFLWFDNQAEEAMKYYMSIFRNSRVLRKLMNDADPEKSKAVMNAMLGMNKIVIADLKKAYESAGACA
jgi:predicted 3-demethylubiquinone-9 3-methyltransferase (glyoxalase superfamily)